MLISRNPLVSAADEDSTESAEHCSRIPGVWSLKLAGHQGEVTGVRRLLDNSRLLQSGCNVGHLIGSFEHFEELGKRFGLAETSNPKFTMCLIGMLLIPLPTSLILGILPNSVLKLRRMA